MTPTAKKIVKLFNERGANLTATDYAITRTHAGRHQRAAGSWKWFLRSATDYKAPRFGSWDCASDLIKSGATIAIYRQDCGDVSLIIERGPSSARAAKRIPKWSIDFILHSRYN